MIECKDLTSNQLCKIDSDIERFPQMFFNYNNGMQLLFIKRLRDGRYAIAGLGTDFHVLEHQSDCDIYFKFDDLVSAKKFFEKNISLLVNPSIRKRQNELCFSS